MCLMGPQVNISEEQAWWSDSEIVMLGLQFCANVRTYTNKSASTELLAILAGLKFAETSRLDVII